MRRFALAAASVVAALMAPATAGAITYGSPDGDAHPSVGGLVSATQYGDGTWLYCSGTLISPTVFLTAAHCAEGDRVGVTFDPAYQQGDKVYAGTFHADPAYNKTQSDPHDIAVVVLDKAIRGITPARLPKAGSLDADGPPPSFTPVVYGGQAINQGGGPKTFSYADVRYVATGTLNSLNPSWLRISMNPSHDDGGTCYGDSGGPNFLGAGATETNIVAGTTITGDTFCRSTNVDYRMDTPSARGFLASYVALP